MNDDFLILWTEKEKDGTQTLKMTVKENE
jgi:hypothetical protein